MMCCHMYSPVPSPSRILSPTSLFLRCAVIWDTSNVSLRAGIFDGIGNLTIFTSVIQIVPILLVFLLPATKEEQIRMRDDGISSRVGGGILAFTVVTSLTFTIGLNVYLLATNSE